MMKKIRTYLTAALMAAVILPSATSCLGDDNDDDNTPSRELTASEKSIIMLNVDGSYEGKLYYVNNEQKEDSIDIHYTINATDSVLRISDFDFKTLERASLTWGEELSKTVGKAGQAAIELVLHPYYNQYLTAGDYTFNYSNEHPTSAVYTEEEKEHTVQMTMGQYVDYVYMYETLRYSNFIEYYSSMMQGNLIIKSLTVDGVKADVNTVLGFKGKKI